MSSVAASSVTLKDLFTRIAGPSKTVNKARLEAFIEDAGVSNSFFAPKASMAATAIMDKFDDGSGQVGWERFRTRGLALVPAGLVAQVDVVKIATDVDNAWKTLDPQGKDAVDVGTMSLFIEAQLNAKGASFASTKADAGARVLLHALDNNGDRKLQKAEIKGFLLDVAAEAKAGA